MKNKILIYLFVFIFLSINAKAQTADRNIEEFKKEVSENGLTYIYSSHGFNRTNLENKNSLHISKLFAPKDATCKFDLERNINVTKLLTLYFTEDEVSALKHSVRDGLGRRIRTFPFSMFFIVKLSTGEVECVTFFIPGLWDPKLLPLSRLNEIEKALKENLKYKVTKRLPDVPCDQDITNEYTSIGYEVSLEDFEGRFRELIEIKFREEHEFDLSDGRIQKKFISKGNTEYSFSFDLESEFDNKFVYEIFSTKTLKLMDLFGPITLKNNTTGEVFSFDESDIDENYAAFYFYELIRGRYTLKMTTKQTDRAIDFIDLQFSFSQDF